MKRQKNVEKAALVGIVTASAVIVLTMLGPVFAAPPIPGTTILVFSDNPATLSGDSAPDVTISTTTTSAGGAALVSEGKVMIELATDGVGNPVPLASVVAWVALNDPGIHPDGSGVTTLDVDLDALGFVCDTVAGFRAHYVTGGGGTKVATHSSDELDLTAVCDCGCDVTESAFAYSADAGTCFIDIDMDQDGEGDFSRWGWSIGPLQEGSYSFDIYAAAGQCDLANGALVGRLDVLYSGGTATVTYVMDMCRLLTETHVYIGTDPVPTGASGNYTVAPGQYGNTHEGSQADPIGDGDQYVIEGLSGEIYLISHAVVCME